MSRITRCAVLVMALVSSLAVMSPSAGAVTWHNSGNTAFTATGSATTLSAGAAGLACPAGGTMTATVGATPYVGIVWDFLSATLLWSGCTLGVSGYSVDCAYTLTASAWQALVPFVTSGTADLTCGVYIAGVKSCHIEGTVPSRYTDPWAPGPYGFVTLQTGGQLTATNATLTCPLGHHVPVHMMESGWQITGYAGGTGSGGPRITRTA